jgi:glutamine synthetase
VDERDRQVQGTKARDMGPDLAAKGVELVAVTFVDNSGVTRVKAVPLARLESAASWGIGAAPCFDGFTYNDLPGTIAGPDAPGAVGDLRLHPDLGRLTPLAAQPGWAWAPGDRYEQDGTPHEIDPRTMARDAVSALAAAGYTARAAFEVEWMVGRQTADDAWVPAVRGSAYGFGRVAELADYLRAVVAALTAQGVGVQQIHPEYAHGQFELSVTHEDPVGTADTLVLVRETIRAVTVQYGLRASFSPKVQADGLGTGGHVHLSVWRDGANIFAGGDGPLGLTTEAAQFTAGILTRLPALVAIGAPSMASYLRLVPKFWAGAFIAWGLENRETAIRLIAGAAGSRTWAANIEVKCFDQSANPYLVMAAVLRAGLAGLTENAVLPPPVDVDPTALGEEGRAERGIAQLPTSLADAVDALEADATLTKALGERFMRTFIGVRRTEMFSFTGMTPEQIVDAYRWVY